MAEYETSSPDEEDTSEDFEERLSALKAKWKAALKRNKKLLLKCPNYDRCGFKCGSVGGMNYHFIRCAGKSPEFKCIQCNRSYESRTGLNYHNASFHSNESTPEDIKSESTARPQRSAALTTMSAIHIANNLPPLKQTYQKPPSASPHKTTPQGSTHHNTTPPKKAATPTNARSGKGTSSPGAVTKGGGVHGSKSTNVTATSQKSSLPSPTLKTTPPKQKMSPTVAPVSREQVPFFEVKLQQPAIILPKKVATPPPPLPELIEEPLIIHPSPKKSPLLSPSLKPACKQPKADGSGEIKKKGGRYITIPSIEYPNALLQDKYKFYLPLWRQEMKDNATIKCPNFSECEFKCTTVNGMKYHFVRCMKSNPPEFNCELCEKRFQCRTGLVWHLKKTHKMIDIHPTKSGGYKGSLPIELKFDSDLEDEDDDQLMEAFQLAPQTVSPVSPVKKKIKLDKPWGRQRPSTGYGADGSHEEDSALESSAQSGSEGDDELEMDFDDTPSSRRRLRKCLFPQRTADAILQNTAFSRVPPKPRLGPPTSKFHVPATKFSISNEIATDVDPKPSFDLFLGVEALEWQKMYSDSESESDYNPEYDDTGRVINYQSNSSVSDSDEEFMCSLTTRKKTTGGQRGPKPRGGGGGAGGPGRPRRGRGARSNVETNSGNSSRDVPMLVKPPEDMSYGAGGSLLDPGIHPPPILIKHQPQDLNNTIAATAATTTNATTAVGEEVRSSAELRVAHLPSVPALVKAPERMGSESNEIEEFDRLTSIGLPPPQQQQQQHPPHHIQPPPSLVMPSPSSSISTPSIVPISSSSLSSLPSVGSHQRRREPPPLVRNTDKMTTPNSAIELQDSTSHGSRPQIICLSPGEQQQQQLQHQRRTPQQAGIPQQGSLSYSIVTQAPQPSYSIVTQQQQTSRNSQLSAASVDGGGRGRGRGRGGGGGGGGGGQQPAPHKPRRPGRPRKDQSVTLSTGLRTSAKTVRLGGGGGGAEGGGGSGGGGGRGGRGGSSTRAHYRSGRGGGRAGQNSSQSTKKGMKMTQYEFENVSSSAFPPSLVSGGIPQALQQQQQQQVQQQQAVAAQQQQPQLFQLGSGAAGVAQSLQSLVTPLQIIPTASIPGYHSVSGGGMLLLQNAPQGVTLAASPSGNDVVAPTNFLGGNTYQLVQAAPMITTDQGENAQKVSVIMHPTAGPVQYIAQFDGPPPKGKSSTKTPQSRKKLHEKFNKERKKEQAKLEQNTTAVMSTKLTKSKSKRSKTTDSDSTVVASGSASISAEKLMSSELEKYLKVEESRKKRKSSTSTTAATDAAAASSSDSGTGRKTKASTSTIKRRKKQPDPVTSSPPKNVQETPGTEEEEVARVPEREEESGEPSGTKKTRTKAKKKSLLGKRKSRAKEETQEEDDDGEQQLPPNNEEGGPPTSSSPTKRDKTKSRDQEEKVEERERTIPADSEAASEVVMETESPQRSYTAARRGGRGRGRSKRMKIDSSNQETEHERTTPASSKEATMETQISTAVATSNKRGSRRGRGRGSGTVPATDGKMHIPQLTSESTWEECTKVWRSSLKRKKGAHCPKCGSYKGNSISAMKYHWQRCGKTQEELTVSCPECDKTFQSEAGLSYHTRFHHSQPQEASTSNATPTVDIFAEVDITKPIPERRAAKQAAERLNQLTRSIGVQAATTTTTTAPTSSSPGDVHVDEVKGDVGGAGAGVYVGGRGGGGGENFEEEFGFSQEEMLSFKAKIEREKSVNCPVEDCERVFKSYKGLQYHLKRHRVPKDSLPCPHCKKVLAGRKRFENHIRLRHPDMDVELVSMDYEYRPSVHADSDEEDPEELDAEKSAEKSAEKDVGKGRGGTKRKQRRTRAGSLLIAGAPVTLHQYQKTLKEKLEHLYGHREGEGVGKAEQGEEGPLTSASWQPMTEDWSRVPNSELAFYLPTSKQSMTYALEVEGKGKGETAEAVTADCTLPLFGTAESSDGTTMFFTGGPVWAMDWLCTRDGQDTPSTDAAGERHLVLAAYRDYDETFPIDAHLSHKGLLQVWSAGDLTRCEQGLPPSSSSSSPSSSPRSLPRLKLGIAHNFGCIRSIKSCPHDNGLMVGVASKGDTPLRQHHLGVLALACSDGCARILNIPDPAHLQSVLPSPKKTAAKSNAKQVNVDPTALFVKPRRVSAILVPSGLGVQDWSSFGQCLCIDWFPGNQHTRIAAGYYNGCVCVWDLGSSLLNGGCGAAAALGARQQLHPLIQIMGQSEPCRALAWCPHDSNYLVTGGYTKCLTLWDIRQPFSPVDRQDKGFTSYEIVWPLLWCHTLLRYDTSGSAGPSHSHGIVHSSYVVKPQQATNRMVTSNLGPLCSMSYSDWTDRVVASSFAGDVSVTSFDGNYHLTSLTDHKNFLPNTNRHKIVCYCYTKPLEQSSSEPGDEPQVSDSSAPAVAAVSSQSSPSTMKEKARTHRLIFSRHHHLSPQSRAGSFQPDAVPLAAFTKVCWSPDQGTSEWLLLATTSGLVQLLRLPRKLN